VSNDIYIGTEAEGRLKGVQTVFAQRPSLEAVGVATKCGITHVFFGVRGHRLLEEDYETLEKLLGAAIPPEWIVSLHVELERASFIPAWAVARCHILLHAPLAFAPFLSGDVEVKLENRWIAAVYSRPQILDLTYVRDQEAPCKS
jgi:hypothetical protein